MKRSILSCLCFLACACVGFPAFAQTTAVTAPAGSITMGGSAITTGTVTFIPVDTNGNPVALTKSGGGLNLPGATSKPLGYSCAIAAGAVTGCSVPDQSLTSPSGFRYNLTFADTAQGDAAYGLSFPLNQVTGISGASFRLDQYAPATSYPTATAFTYTTGASAPTDVCASPAQYLATGTNTLYACNGVTWVALTSGGASVALQTNGTANSSQVKLNLVAGANVTVVDNGNGSVTISSSGGSGSGTSLAIGTVTTLPAGSQATASIVGGALNIGIPAGAAGEAGAAGAAGTNGTTPVFTIGTVTTLAAGASATASVTGTAANPILNLGVPAGAAGANGSGSVSASVTGVRCSAGAGTTDVPCTPSQLQTASSDPTKNTTVTFGQSNTGSDVNSTLLAGTANLTLKNGRIAYTNPGMSAPATLPETPADFLAILQGLSNCDVAGGYAFEPFSGGCFQVSGSGNATTVNGNVLPVSAGPLATDSGGHIIASACPRKDAENICILEAPYSGSDNGNTTTTTSAAVSSGATSFAVASCGTFVAGNGIDIPSITFIGTIASCSGTTMTLSAGVSAAVALGATVQHDETAAINAAIAALPLTTGGTIWFPSAPGANQYLANGPLLQTGGANAILPMPSIVNYSGNQLYVGLRGVNPVSNGSTSGAYLITQQTSGNLIGGYDSTGNGVGGGNFVPFTNVNLQISDMEIQGPATATITLVNASNILAFTGRNLEFLPYPVQNATSATAPTGLLLPIIDNVVSSEVDNVYVNGMALGIQLTEHTTGHDLRCGGSYKCFVADSGTSSVANGFLGNGIFVDHMFGESSTYVLAAGAHLVQLHVSDLDCETDANCIYDPSSYLRGIANVVQPNPTGTYGGYGDVAGVVGVVGANNLQIESLYDPFIKTVNSTLTGPNASGTSKYLVLENPNIAGDFASFFGNVVGGQMMAGTNCYYNGTGWVYGGSTACAAIRSQNTGTHGVVSMNVVESGTAGAAVTGEDTTGAAYACMSTTTSGLNYCVVNGGSSTPTAVAGTGFNVANGLYQEKLYTPTSSSATCVAGQFADDASYHYVCVATNTWERVALTTF